MNVLMSNLNSSKLLDFSLYAMKILNGDGLFQFLRCFCVFIVRYHLRMVNADDPSAKKNFDR